MTVGGMIKNHACQANLAVPKDLNIIPDQLHTKCPKINLGL
jgi:hypothetical protein